MLQGPKRFAGRHPKEERASPFDHLDVERVVQGVEPAVAQGVRAWWDVAEPESKKLGGKIMNKQMVQFVANFVQWLHVTRGQPEGAILVFCTGVPLPARSMAPRSQTCLVNAISSSSEFCC